MLGVRYIAKLLVIYLVPLDAEEMATVYPSIIGILLPYIHDEAVAGACLPFISRAASLSLKKVYNKDLMVVVYPDRTPVMITGLVPAFLKAIVYITSRTTPSLSTELISKPITPFKELNP
jgi:hypothetical protein